MKQIYAYLNFNGNAREAMTFYKQCLGGELTMSTFAEMPGDIPAETKDLIMHAELRSGDAVLMASDTMPGMTSTVGSNVWICVAPESVEETDRMFNAMKEGGSVTMPLADAFWGAYFGMLQDKFGNLWMFNFQKEPHA